MEKDENVQEEWQDQHRTVTSIVPCEETGTVKSRDLNKQESVGFSEPS